MKLYYATLNRTIETHCTFESTDVQTGNKLPEYQVPMTLREGPRRFKTKRQALAWVELINAEYGQGTAQYTPMPTNCLKV